MAELIADCPRCNAKHTTFDIWAHVVTESRRGWENHYEAFCTCRHCKRSTIFQLYDSGQSEAQYLAHHGLMHVNGTVNELVGIAGFVSQKDSAAASPPDHLPPDLKAVFEEGAMCLAVGCFNAAGTMFRLCIDLATKSALPEDNSNGLNSATRRNLGLRLPWLIAQGILPEALRELSACIKEDGNDGAHEGTLQKEDAADLLDFTEALLERLYTEPERLRLAKERREKRRESGIPG